MRKHLTLLIALVLMSAGFSTKAQTVDKILDSYFENTGGKDKWTNLKNMTMEGKAEAQGRQFPVKIYQHRPNLTRMELTFQGKTLVQQAYDGKDAWGIDFASGKNQKKSAEAAKELSEDEFEPFYLNYSKKGHKIVLDGKEEIEGTECNKLKVTKKNGDVVYLFFDTESDVLLMSRSTVKTGGAKGKQAEAYFSDYKEVGGLMLPHSFIQKVEGNKFELTIEKISVNPKIDKSIFSLPKN